MNATNSNQTSVSIGDYVSVRMPRGNKRGYVVSIQAPPRELTGGRGVAIRFDYGGYGDGWDVSDLQVLRKA